jgi:hypothetical protein
MPSRRFLYLWIAVYLRTCIYFGIVSGALFKLMKTHNEPCGHYSRHITFSEY